MDFDETQEWDELSPKIKLMLDISIEQSLKGEVRPHEEIMAERKKKIISPDSFNFYLRAKE